MRWKEMSSFKDGLRESFEKRSCLAGDACVCLGLAARLVGRSKRKQSPDKPSG
jgi:hypothetical protein